MSARDLPFLWAPPEGAPDAVAFVNDDGPAAGVGGSRDSLVPNPRLQDVQLLEGVFSPEECGRIIALGAARPMWSGRCTSDDPRYRSCLTAWIEWREENAWVFARVSEVVAEANRPLGFEISGFGEPLHYVEYGSGDGFDWHSDLSPGRGSNRKLSVSVQLSAPEEYAGGELELCPHGRVSGFRNQGSALVFPAYMPHRVHRVETGKRHALIAWIHGPTFR